MSPASFLGPSANVATLALVGCVVLTAGCFDPDRVKGPPLGYESDPEACSDGRDNDRDGMIDCRDSSCLGESLCSKIIIEGLPPEPENTFEKCTDRIDNDQDGNWDCGDRNCQAIRELCCVTEFSDSYCSDGVDNDENGFRDCGDFSCRQNPFVTACDAETVCDDGQDNDEDDDTDCEDEDCAGVAGCPPLPDPEPEDTIEKCSDGIDNDRNGYRDCGDFSCSDADDPAVTAFCAERLENNVERCSDGIDNDGNGYTDCEDFSCSRSTDPEVMELCTSTEEPVDEEDDFEECQNGLDDDGDGFADCSDFSCRAVVQEGRTVFNRAGEERVVTASPCQESITPSVPNPEADPVTAIREASDRCSNGVDEDSDGFFDCEDWDCQWNPLLKPAVEDYMRAGRTLEQAEASEDGFCQGWRFNRNTLEWSLVDPFIDFDIDPNDPADVMQINRPLLCR